MVNRFKDPLWTFLLFGILLFAVAAWQDEDRIIRVSAGDIERLTMQWQQQMRRPPTAAERQSLIDQFIRDEAYYQEALRLGLDINDTIVRRRLIQKITFLTEDLAASTPIEPGTLENFYARNIERYETPEAFTFQHIYFSADRQSQAEAEDARVMASKAVADPAIPGDPFMLQRQYVRRSQREVGDLFGKAFAAELAALAVQANWQGPIKSAYGWHAVRLEARQPARAQPFQQVKENVLLDWRQQQRTAANEAYLDQLLSTYQILVPETNSIPASK